MKAPGLHLLLHRALECLGDFITFADPFSMCIFLLSRTFAMTQSLIGNTSAKMP